MSWVYLNSEPGLYTVGFYDPQGKWQPDSDYLTQDEAARRVHYLNGGAVSKEDT
jgi:hypothetical protein